MPLHKPACEFGHVARALVVADPVADHDRAIALGSECVTAVLRVIAAGRGADHRY